MRTLTLKLLYSINSQLLFVLCRVTKLGGVSISDEEKETILKARKEAESLYQVAIKLNVDAWCECVGVPVQFVV